MWNNSDMFEHTVKQPGFTIKCQVLPTTGGFEFGAELTVPSTGIYVHRIGDKRAERWEDARSKAFALGLELATREGLLEGRTLN